MTKGCALGSTSPGLNARNDCCSSQNCCHFGSIRLNGYCFRPLDIGRGICGKAFFGAMRDFTNATGGLKCFPSSPGSPFAPSVVPRMSPDASARMVQLNKSCSNVGHEAGRHSVAERTKLRVRDEEVGGSAANHFH